MRSFRFILALSGAVMLAACGESTQPQTVGSNPPGVTPTPTPANFLDVTATTSYDVIGGFQALSKQTNTTTGAVSTLYTANAATVNAPNGTISYSPRDGVFTLTVADTTAGVSREIRFQDPAHRVQYNAAGFASRQVPNLANFNYLEVFDGTANPVFFYERPGTRTAYVSLGGYSRTTEDATTGNFTGERGVFVFGQKTPNGQVPTSGSGTYAGGFLASMIVDPSGGGSTYLQWISGTSNIGVDFGTGKVSLAVNGTVGDAYSQGGTVNAGSLFVPAGSAFKAVGTAQVDLSRSGGFTGVFTQNSATANNVGFTNGGAFTGIDFASVAAGGATAGASSIDGAFYGPNAVNVGGNFRIVGGVPNQRVDILGAFTGGKQ